MFINDFYKLKASNPIEIQAHEEATINLELEKVPPCYQTLLTGKILYKCLPIKNATVMVLDEDCKPLFHTLTDEYGFYRINNILNPGKYKVIASAIGYKTSKIITICIKENEVNKQSFTLKKSLIVENGIVYGKILESGSKKPIENAVVYLKSMKDGCKMIYKASSNSSGQYLIYNIIPNDYVIIIEKQGYMESDPLELTIEKYDRILLYFDLIINSYYCKNTISGAITLKETPISEVAVFLYLLDEQKNEKVVQIQETNENGFFLFSNVESGLYIVKAKMQNSVVYEQIFSLE